MSVGERAAMAFAGKTQILMACERYERRAISRRNRALQGLAKLQRELRREEAIELVGPPRPKSQLTRHIPFREDVLRLEVERVMRRFASTWAGGLSCSYEWQFGKSIFGGQPSKSTVGVHVRHEGDHGFLDLRFQVDGESRGAWLRDASANLGVSLDRDALANLGSAELDDIAVKRVTEIALRRRRRNAE